MIFHFWQLPEKSVLVILYSSVVSHESGLLYFGRDTGDGRYTWSPVSTHQPNRSKAVKGVEYMSTKQGKARLSGQENHLKQGRN